MQARGEEIKYQTTKLTGKHVIVQEDNAEKKEKKGKKKIIKDIARKNKKGTEKKRTKRIRKKRNKEKRNMKRKRFFFTLPARDGEKIKIRQIGKTFSTKLLWELLMFRKKISFL